MDSTGDCCSHCCPHPPVDGLLSLWPPMEDFCAIFWRGGNFETLKVISAVFGTFTIYPTFNQDEDGGVTDFCQQLDEEELPEDELDLLRDLEQDENDVDPREEEEEQVGILTALEALEMVKKHF